MKDEEGTKITFSSVQQESAKWFFFRFQWIALHGFEGYRQNSSKILIGVVLFSKEEWLAYMMVRISFT